MRRALAVLVVSSLVLAAPGPFAYSQTASMARSIQPIAPINGFGLPGALPHMRPLSPAAGPTSLGAFNNVPSLNSAPGVETETRQATPSLPQLALENSAPAVVPSPAASPAAANLRLSALLSASPSEVPAASAEDLAKMPDTQAKGAGDQIMDRLLGAKTHQASGDIAGPEQAPRSFAGSVERLGQGLRVYEDEPERYSLDHNTIKDLGLADKDDIFKVLDKTQTYPGAVRLRNLVQNPFLDSAEIRKRQQAVQTILKDSALKASLEAAFKALGKNADHRLWNHFFDPKTDRVVHFILPNILGLAFPVTLFLGGWRLAVQFTMPFLMLGGRSLSALQDLRAAFLRYKAVFRLARDLAGPLSSSNSPALQEVGRVFSGTTQPGHPLDLRSAGRTFSHVQSRILMAPLDFFIFLSAKTLWWVQRVFMKARDRIAHLLGALAELDVYMSLAKLAQENPAWSTFPVIRDPGPAYLKIESGHHPLVLAYKKEQSVSNSLDLEARAGNFRLVTGSNMGGKTTYLRMAALLSILAQAGLPVPAKSMEATPLEVATSIDISDSLKEGKSLYDAETDRVLSIIRKAQGSQQFLAIMDEILQGTNPEERTAAERAIVRYLAATPNLFMVATHNLNIADLVAEISGIRNYHVEDKRPDGRPGFPYEVQPGPATTKNGITTLEKKGFPKEIVQEARRSLDPAK
ncbi:MAG: hypothetical protein HZB91_11535 [Elusimicrobia bacterium]|nr:hypothetical protein [Elusimicrobiota bacterium]